MQFNKASKKTRNIAEETNTPAPENSAAGEVTANPRTTRSSKTKKTEITETGPVKHRHNKLNSAPEAAAASATTGKTLAAVAGAGSVIVDPVGVMAPAAGAEAFSPEVELPREVAHEEIAKLAYSFWTARGYSHGSQEEDWLRAERELRQRR